MHTPCAHLINTSRVSPFLSSLHHRTSVLLMVHGVAGIYGTGRDPTLPSALSGTWQHRPTSQNLARGMQ